MGRRGKGEEKREMDRGRKRNEKGSIDRERRKKVSM